MVEAEGSEHAEEGRQSPDSTSDLDNDHPRASPPKDVAAAARTPEVSEEEPKAEAVVKEVVNLITSEEEEEEGPMPTEEFLQKRESMRRGEWTKAKELLDKESSATDDESDTEEEPAVQVGPASKGPPLYGPLRAESLSKHLEAMKRNGATEAEIAERKRQIMPVCFMMNESPATEKEEEQPAAAPKPPSPSEEEEMHFS